MTFLPTPSGIWFRHRRWSQSSGKWTLFSTARRLQMLRAYLVNGGMSSVPPGRSINHRDYRRTCTFARRSSRASTETTWPGKAENIHGPPQSIRRRNATPASMCFKHTSQRVTSVTIPSLRSVGLFSLLRHQVSTNHRQYRSLTNNRSSELAQIERESTSEAQRLAGLQVPCAHSTRFHQLLAASPSSQHPARSWITHVAHLTCFPTCVLLRLTLFEELVPVTVIVFSLCATLESIPTPAFDAPCILQIVASLSSPYIHPLHPPSRCFATKSATDTDTWSFPNLMVGLRPEVRSRPATSVIICPVHTLQTVFWVDDTASRYGGPGRKSASVMACQGFRIQSSDT